MDEVLKEKLKKYFEFIYPDINTNEIIARVEEIVEKYNKRSKNSSWINEKDAMLITYGDSITEEGKPGLETLNKFLMKNVKTEKMEKVNKKYDNIIKCTKK